MWIFIWHTFFFDPIYNLLVFLIDTIPGGDVGLAIILTTIIVKFFLLPLSIKAVKTQMAMRKIDPKLKELKVKFKENKEEQAREMMKLYKDEGVHPLASVGVMLIQIPIIIALYLSVSRGGGVSFPNINTDILFSFVPEPAVVSMMLFGVVDIAAKHLPLALLAGITQFFQARLAMPTPEPRDPNAAPDFKSDMQRSMSMQMRYVLPVIIFFVAYSFASFLALYFVVSNLFAIAQELYVKKHRS